MPEIIQNTNIKISPEKFLNACSVNELAELDLLIQSPRYQNKIKGYEDSPIIPSQLELAHEASNSPFKYTCTICHENSVDADNGFDTCTDCLAKM